LPKFSHVRYCATLLRMHQKIAQSGITVCERPKPVEAF